LGTIGVDARLLYIHFSDGWSSGQSYWLQIHNTEKKPSPITEDPLIG
jgi:hypothetical protein